MDFLHTLWNLLPCWYKCSNIYVKSIFQGKCSEVKSVSQSKHVLALGSDLQNTMHILYLAFVSHLLKLDLRRWVLLGFGLWQWWSSSNLWRCFTAVFCWQLILVRLDKIPVWASPGCSGPQLLVVLMISFSKCKASLCWHIVQMPQPVFPFRWAVL